MGKFLHGEGISSANVLPTRFLLAVYRDFFIAASDPVPSLAKLIRVVLLRSKPIQKRCGFAGPYGTLRDFIVAS
jgi:hypothetical protein